MTLCRVGWCAVTDEKERQFQILLEEYRAHRDEIQKRLEAQDRLLSYIIALMTGAVAGILPLKDKLGDFLWIAILSIALPISLLAAMSALNDVWIAVMASYIEQVLRPQLRELSATDVLRWEQFWRSARLRPYFRLVLSFLRPITYLAPSLTASLLFILYRRTSPLTYEWMLFAINVILLAILGYAVYHTMMSYLEIVHPRLRSSLPKSKKSVWDASRRTRQIVDLSQVFMQPGQRVLDFGAGTGRCAVLMRDVLKVNITAVDVVAYARVDIPIVTYDGRRLPFRDKSFDVSLAAFTLHHCVDPEVSIRELARVTRCRIIVIEDTWTGAINKAWLYLLEFVMNRVYTLKVPLPFNFKTPQQWLELFNRNRLRIVHSKEFKSTVAGLRHAVFVLEP